MDKTKRSPYPPHLNEPIRLELARELVCHELKKFFPSVTDSEVWQNIDHDIEGWLVEQNNPSLLEAPRDFWDGIDTITRGFKLKNIVPFLTAENVSWRKEKMAIGDIVFGSKLEPLKKFDNLGKEPKASGVILCYEKSPEAKEAAKKESDEFFGRGFPREDDPIIVEEKIRDDEAGETALVVHDGNGRLLRKILYDRNEIGVYIGRREAGGTLKNYWVSAAYLLKIKSDFHDDDDENEVELVRIYKRIGQKSQSSFLRNEIERALQGWPKEKIQKILAAVFNS